LDRSIQLLLAPTGEKDVSSLLGIPLRSSETNPAIAPVTTATFPSSFGIFLTP
jgi:hypothetical protein